MKIIIVISTYPTKKSALSISKKLLEEKLTACANITLTNSIYYWKGKIEHKNEYMVFFKTNTKNKSLLKKTIFHNHPYEVSEILEINSDSFNLPYFKWLNDNVKH